MRNPAQSLASNIEKFLQANDRKPAWLAKAAKVDPSGLGRILKGEGNPSLEVIDRIAQALGCEPGELLKPNHPTLSGLARGEFITPPKPAPTLVDAIEVLTAFQGAEHWQRVVAMFFLTQNETWLDELPEEQKSKFLAAR
jgi:transcriptional regulator with XRE-family HTH domain